jgi:hypothetical protein
MSIFNVNDGRYDAPALISYSPFTTWTRGWVLCRLRRTARIPPLGTEVPFRRSRRVKP